MYEGCKGQITRDDEYDIHHKEEKSTIMIDSILIPLNRLKK